MQPSGSVSRIFRSGLASSAGNVIVNGANVGRDAAIALAFGTGVSVDALFLAIMLPVFVVTVGTGAYRNTMVPILEKVAHGRGVESVKRMIGRCMVLNAPIALAAGIVLALCAPWYAPLIAGRLPEDAAASIELLTWAALPMFVVSGYASLIEGPLQTQGVFFQSSVLRAGLPIGMAGGAVFLGPHFGVLGVCYGGLVGAGLQLIGASILTARQGMLQGVWTPLDRGVSKEVGTQFTLLSAGVCLSYISPVINQWMASFLGSGSVSVLSYANRLVLGVASLAMGALGPALLPHFSKLVAKGDRDGLNTHYATVMRLVLWGSVALSGLVWLLSEPVVVLLYERGNFLRADSLAVADIMGWLCLQFPALFVGIVAATLISAVSLNRVFVPMSVLVAIVNVAANGLLMQWYGLAGIAVATTVSYLTSLATMNIALYRAGVVRLPRILLLDAAASLGTASILAIGVTALNGKLGPLPTGWQLAVSAVGVGLYSLAAALSLRPALVRMKEAAGGGVSRELRAA